MPVKVRSRRTPETGAFLVMDIAKQQTRDAGNPVIDLSVGSSDLQPPVEALLALKVSRFAHNAEFSADQWQHFSAAARSKLLHRDQAA